jgi:hypothetical protein
LSAHITGNALGKHKVTEGDLLLSERHFAVTDVVIIARQTLVKGIEIVAQ